MSNNLDENGQSVRGRINKFSSEYFANKIPSFLLWHPENEVSSDFSLRDSGYVNNNWIVKERRSNIFTCLMAIVLFCILFICVISFQFGVGITIFGISIPPNHIKEVANNLGVDPSLDAIENVVDTIIAEGNSKADVFEMLDKIEPKTIRDDEIAIHSIENAVECFSVKFYEALKTLTIDRIFCFDNEQNVVYIIPSLRLK